MREKGEVQCASPAEGWRCGCLPFPFFSLSPFFFLRASSRGGARGNVERGSRAPPPPPRRRPDGMREESNVLPPPPPSVVTFGFRTLQSAKFQTNRRGGREGGRRSLPLLAWQARPPVGWGARTRSLYLGRVRAFPGAGQGQRVCACVDLKFASWLLLKHGLVYLYIPRHPSSGVLFSCVAATQQRGGGGGRGGRIHIVDGVGCVISEGKPWICWCDLTGVLQL